jgi:hypothetical protein
MIKKLKAGTIKRLHVDRHIIAKDRKTGVRTAAITIQTSKGSIKTKFVHVNGPCSFLYPEKPLPCGARVYIETKSEVSYYE